MPSLAQPTFPGDDGTVDPRLETALSELANEGSVAPVLAVLGDVRLLTPVVAVRGDDRASGGGDEGADMAAVLMTGVDGRTALLAFSCLVALQAWDPAARPVPVLGTRAAQAARSGGASAIVLDVAGPVRVVVEEPDLAHVAAGDQLVQTPAGLAWVRLA